MRPWHLGYLAPMWPLRPPSIPARPALEVPAYEGFAARKSLTIPLQRRCRPRPDRRRGGQCMRSLGDEGKSEFMFTKLSKESQPATETASHALVHSYVAPHNDTNLVDNSVLVFDRTR